MLSKEWPIWLKNVLQTYKSAEMLEKVNASGLVAAQVEGTRRTFMDRESGFGQFGTSLVELTWFENERLPSLAIVLGQSDRYEIYEDYLLLNIEPWNYDSEDGYDNEAFRGIFEKLDKMPMHRPLVGLSIIEKFTEPTVRHGVAWVAWKTDESSGSRSSKKRPHYVFSFYDPMNYQKPLRNTQYTYAQEVFMANYEQMIDEHGKERDIHLWDLSVYCYHKTKDEYHCPQYMMNAEYCHLYSLMFLYRWIEHGMPDHRKGMSSVVRSMYLVKPARLTRADTNASLLFRVITMAFTVATLDAYTTRMLRRRNIDDTMRDTLKNIRHLLSVFKQVWKGAIGRSLLYKGTDESVPVSSHR